MNSIRNVEKNIPQYRAVSWWLYWEDMVYPDKEIEEKMLRRADHFAQSGVNLAIIFGAHFRWDFIYIWDRLHELIRFVSQALHERDILLFDHHSANLVHRPPNMERKWNISKSLKHHVPFYPSPEMAQQLSYNGHKLEDFRMGSISTGKKLHLSRYCSDIFCMNNPLFKESYLKYIKILMAETHVDGLMCDDIIYYPAWDACGCVYCRKKFKDRYEHQLPAATDVSFWGNYENEAFKDWIEMRYNDSADFLAGVRDTIGKDFPLLSCCSVSARKSEDAYGANYTAFAQSANHVHLEMCGEAPKSYLRSIPDLLLHLGIGARIKGPNITSSYASFPDPAFFIWGLNKLLASMPKVHSETPTIHGTDNQIKCLPDNGEIVKEAYLFEKNNADLFKGRSMANTAVYYSFETQIFYGDCPDDYEASYRGLVTRLFEKNIQFDVVDRIPAASDYPVLVLADITCMSVKIQNDILKYLGGGGIVIGAGPLGLRDERARNNDTTFLSRFGIKASLAEPSRPVDLTKFFTDPPDDPSPRNVAHACEAMYAGKKIGFEKWLEIKNDRGLFCWTPGRCLKPAIMDKVISRIEDHQENCCSIMEYPPGWFFRMYRLDNKILLHGLCHDFTPVLHKTLTFKGSDNKLVESLDYHGKGGQLVVRVNAREGSLYSPDISNPVPGRIKEGRIYFNLENIRRYFIVSLHMTPSRDIILYSDITEEAKEAILYKNAAKLV